MRGVAPSLPIRLDVVVLSYVLGTTLFSPKRKSNCSPAVCGRMTTKIKFSTEIQTRECSIRYTAQHY